MTGKAESEEPQPIVPPAPTFTVPGNPRPLLYLPDGRILVRKIGYAGTRDKERA